MYWVDTGLKLVWYLPPLSGSGNSRNKTLFLWDSVELPLWPPTKEEIIPPGGGAPCEWSLKRDGKGGIETNWEIYPASTVLKTHWSKVIQDQEQRKWDRWFANGSGNMETGMASSTGSSKWLLGTSRVSSRAWSWSSRSGMSVPITTGFLFCQVLLMRWQPDTPRWSLSLATVITSSPGVGGSKDNPTLWRAHSTYALLTLR